ncbi:MAG: single-stranded DNA-binding protein [Actinomycetia bacterium]|nr:single-stranded DNA-binding protein [Actinomycetes bacterium]
MNDTQITVQGNIITDITLRTTKAGHEVASFRLASTPRRFDRASGQWLDGEATFFSVSCWRVLARNVAESLAKGMPVVVSGRMTQRGYDREVGGELVRSFSLDLDAKLIGPDLNRGIASFQRAPANSVGIAEARSRREAQSVMGSANATTDPVGVSVA